MISHRKRSSCTRHGESVLLSNSPIKLLEWSSHVSSKGTLLWSAIRSYRHDFSSVLSNGEYHYHQVLSFERGLLSFIFKAQHGTHSLSACIRLPAPARTLVTLWSRLEIVE